MNESAVLGNLVWVLPRPRQPYYPGSFPLHFEQRLWRLLGKPERVLHPFGGYAEIGIRVDIELSVKPDIVADAHNLPFRDNCFDIVICDPPYSEEQAYYLYGQGQMKLKFGEWCKEAERVTRSKGFIALYHERWLPKPKNSEYWMRVIVLVSQHHRGRVCGIFQKN